MCASKKASGTTFPDRRPLFYYITDRHQLPLASTEALLEQVKRAVLWGIDFIQVREKDLSDRDLLRLTTRAVHLARGTACRILVNGRIDIALSSGAHGVHLPSKGIQVADVVPFLPAGFLVGASTHSLFEARQAAEGGADYLLLGPIFPTASKIAYGKPLGLRCLDRVCSLLSLPVFGLGGIRPERISKVLATGASGVAGISLFQRDLDLLLPGHLRTQLASLADHSLRR